MTVFFRFPPPYSKYFGFSSFLNVSLVVRDRLRQCSIEKKVFYAKNDHGNHLKDGHQPDHGIHLYEVDMNQHHTETISKELNQVQSLVSEITSLSELLKHQKSDDIPMPTCTGAVLTTSPQEPRQFPAPSPLTCLSSLGLAAPLFQHPPQMWAQTAFDSLEAMDQDGMPMQSTPGTIQSASTGGGGSPEV
jgi:hypothetical protein